MTDSTRPIDEAAARTPADERVTALRSALKALPHPADTANPVMDMRPVRLGLGGPATHMAHERARLRLASWAFTTRRVPPGVASSVLPRHGRPQVGDLVLARVDALGTHANLQLVNGRRRHLFAGDEIVVVYGNRYASSQFEAVIPESLGPCHLVASGGVASRALSWHARMTLGPTQITPIGLLADDAGRRINLRDHRLPPVAPVSGHQPATIAVAGTSMDSGKTQTAVHLVRGLIAAGLRVGYAKVTGTGAGGDIYWLKDVGADPVLDFTDLGLPSTYLAAHEVVEETMAELVAQIAHHGVDGMVLEIADGVFQRETARLVRSRRFAELVGGMLLAAQDSMGAAAGVHVIGQQPIPLLALSGVLTASPLQVAEAREATGLPVYDRDELGSAEVALDLLGRAQHHLLAAADHAGAA